MRIVNGTVLPDLPRTQADDNFTVDEHRKMALQQNSEEVASRIAIMFGEKPNSTALIFEELNQASRASELLNKKIDATITPTETTELNNLQAAKTAIDAIKKAKNDAKPQVVAAGVDEQLTLAERIAEIDAVVVSWP